MAKPEDKEEEDAVKAPAVLDESVTYTLPQIMAYLAKLKSSGKETSVSISAAISRAKLVVDLPVTDVLSNIALVRHHERFAAYQCDRVPIKDNDLLVSLRKGDTLRLTGTLLCYANLTTMRKWRRTTHTLLPCTATERLKPNRQSCCI